MRWRKRPIIFVVFTTAIIVICYINFNLIHAYTNVVNSNNNYRCQQQQQRHETCQLSPSADSYMKIRIKCCSTNGISQRRRQRPSSLLLLSLSNLNHISDNVSIPTVSNISIKDIQWKIRPCEHPTILQMIQWRILGIRMFIRYRIIRNIQPPIFPSSSSSMIVLLAYYKKQVIGRFGIVPESGPISPPPLVHAVRRIFYNDDTEQQIDDNTGIQKFSNQIIHDNDDDNNTIMNDQNTFIRAAAIVYMFVEPEYRHQMIGTIALEIIAYIHASCGCHYTILVANDTGRKQQVEDEERSSNITQSHNHELKLVQWYERHGYHIAPEIQDLVGSPNGIYGISMIGRTTTPTTTTTSTNHQWKIQWW